MIFPGYIFDPLAVLVGAATALIIALIAQSYSLFFRRWLDGLDARRLTKRLEKDAYSPAGFKKAALDSAKIYVRPDCEDADPASEKDPRNRRPLFRTMDDLLGPPLKSKCLFLLAESGMGKSEFLQQYYRYHWESERRSIRFSLVVVLLNSPQANDLIARVPLTERGNTVLFLDALDEDNAAIKDLGDRVRELIELTKGFRAILITCRTQFVADKALPSELDVPIVEGPVGLNDGPDRSTRRLYLSRLSDRQVSNYIAERFPLFTHPIYRYRAQRAATRFRDIIARPLILTFVQDLITEKSVPQRSYEVYNIILEAWLKREEKKKRLATSRDDLLHFAELFAGQLFVDGVPGLPGHSLQGLADGCSIKLNVTEIRERSLLIYVDGQWGFIHRSIMEYLLVRDAEKAPEAPVWMKSERPWTDQMQIFAWEMILNNRKLPYARINRIPLGNYPLRGVDFSRLRLDGADASGVDFRNVLGLTISHAAAVTSDLYTQWPVMVINKAHKDDITCCAMTMDDEMLLTGSADHTVKFWELKTGRMIRSLELPQPGIAVCCAASLASDLFAVGIGSSLYVCSRQYGFARAAWRSPGASITCCAAIPGGDLFVIGTTDSTLTVWDARFRTTRWTLRGLQGEIRCCAVATGAMLVVAGSSNGKLGTWDLITGQLLNTQTVHEEDVACCSINTTGSLVVSGSRDRTVQICDPKNPRSVNVLGMHWLGVFSCVLLPNQDLAVTGSTDGTMRIWDCKSKSWRTTLRGHSNRVACCATNSRQTMVVSASFDRTIRLWFSQT